MSKQAAILCIGTEITSGEIVNTNGAWLGERLEELGFEITSQVVVPDDKDLILDAIDWIKLQADLLVVSGGLGPTTDDITREVIAEWAGQQLVFSEAEWQKMIATYAERGQPIREAHRQQCHFPNDSRSIPNPVGTALGFSLDAKNLRLVVLPGPPRELHGMWSEHVLPYLKELSPKKATELLIWTCLGVPESEAAEVAEQAIKGSGLTIGYRATVPYVKVKLWVPFKMTDREQWIGRLNKALGPWVVGRGQEDLLQDLLRATDSFPAVTVRDGLSQGRLASRLLTLREKQIPWPKNLSIETGRGLSGVTHALANDHVLMSLREGKSANSFLCDIQIGRKFEKSEIELPYKIQASSARGANHATELAFQWWLKVLPGIRS